MKHKERKRKLEREREKITQEYIVGSEAVGRFAGGVFYYPFVISNSSNLTRVVSFLGNPEYHNYARFTFIADDLTSFYMTWNSEHQGNNTLHIRYHIYWCFTTSEYAEADVSMSNNTDISIWSIEYDPPFLKLYYEQQEAFKYEFKSSDRRQCLTRVVNKTLIGVSFENTNTLKVLLHSHLNRTNNGKLFID